MRRPSSAGLSVIVAAILCVLAIGAAVFSATWVFKDQSGIPTKTWFYDMNSKEIFAAPAESIPPIEAPSGDLQGKAGEPAGVGAVVLKVDGENRIAYLYTYDAKTKQLLEAQNEGDPDALNQTMPPERWVATPDGGKWVSEMSEEGSKLIQDALMKLGENAEFSMPE